MKRMVTGLARAVGRGGVVGAGAVVATAATVGAGAAAGPVAGPVVGLAGAGVSPPHATRAAVAEATANPRNRAVRRVRPRAG